MKVMPITASRKNSAGLNDSTIGSRTGIIIAKTIAPMMPPTPDAVMLAPRARPASPFLAIG
jgi:hypothetical protein